MIHHLKKMHSLVKETGNKVPEITSEEQAEAVAQDKERAAQRYIDMDSPARGPEKEGAINEWARQRQALRNYAGENEEAPAAQPEIAQPEMAPQQEPATEERPPLTDEQVQQYRDKYNLAETPKLGHGDATEIAMQGPSKYADQAVKGAAQKIAEHATGEYITTEDVPRTKKKSVEKTAQKNPSAQYQKPGEDTSGSPNEGPSVPDASERIGAKISKMKKMMHKMKQPTKNEHQAEQKADLMGYK